jgi:BclB C-terminal domain-containing protein
VPAAAVVVGYGSSAEFAIGSGTINIATGPQLAFSLPRDGTLTSISAVFRVSLYIGIETTTVTAQVYCSTTPNNVFSPLPGAGVSLVLPLGSSGTVLSGSTAGLAIPLLAGTRCLTAYTASHSGTSNIEAFGFAGGGIAIQ